MRGPLFVLMLSSQILWPSFSYGIVKSSLIHLNKWSIILYSSGFNISIKINFIYASKFMLLKKYIHSFESFLNLICYIVALSMYCVVAVLGLCYILCGRYIFCKYINPCILIHYLSLLS